MSALYMTRGLPGSGKTTWAKSFQEAQRAGGNETIKRVNKDELRLMLDNGAWSKENEPFIVAVRNAIVEDALRTGKSIIVDDTGFNPVHEKQLRRMADTFGARFDLVDFTYVSLATCIERDAVRSKPVGEAVIRKMHETYLANGVSKVMEAKVEQDNGSKVSSTWQLAPPYDPVLPDVYLCDIDGTVALKGDRGRYDETRVDLDRPNEPVIRVVRSLMDSGAYFVFMSGRKEACRAASFKWLEDYVRMSGPCWHYLHMRSDKDNRKDSVVKLKLYDKYIRGRFNVLGVFDDRQQVVDMWRELGLTCFQVAPGNF